MRRRHDYIRPRRCRPAGFTFVEMLLAVAITAILMGAIGSVITVASRSIDDGTSRSARTLESARVLEDLATDLRLALHFMERTDTVVEFTVPDRDADDAPEIIRWEWTGPPDLQLLRQYHPSKETIKPPAVVVAEDVQVFDLDYVLKTWGPPPPPPEVESSETLLFVHDDDPGGVDVTGPDTDRISLLESWGFTVTLIDAGASQAEFDLAVPSADVAYIASTNDAATVGTKLRNASIGVVSEVAELTEELGLTNQPGVSYTKDKIKILFDDYPHYITDDPIGDGDIKLADNDLSLVGYPGGLGSATFLAKHADNPKDPALVVIDPGTPLGGVGGGTAPARRVFMPWGDPDFDVNLLNDDAKLIMRRAVEWAGERETLPGGTILYLVDGLGTGLAKFNLQQDIGVAQYIPPPPLPVNAISWEVTRFLIILEPHGPDVGGEYDVSIAMPGGDYRPTTLTLWTDRIKEDELPPPGVESEILVDGAANLDPAQGLCFTVLGRKQKDGKKDGLLAYEANPDFVTPGPFWSVTTDKGATWSTPVDDKRIRIWVYGTYTTIGAEVW